jgi:hypothetical protein
MDMSGGISAMDVIVLIVILFSCVFSAAWAISPNLRTWIERPKYRFLAEVEDYDQKQRSRPNIF